MKIIRKRERLESVSYQHSWDYEDLPGAGFGFDCDEHGNVDVGKLQPAGRASYEACMRGSTERWEGVTYKWDPASEDHVLVYDNAHKITVRLVDQGVQKIEHSYVEPAVGECACGAHVTLYGFTNTCECGRDYNSAGQLLAPREFWGEETGESLDEILSIK